MSLIGDALKKARAERGSDLPANVYSVPAPRRSSAPWIVAAASLSLAVGVIVGAAVFYRGGTAEEESAGAETQIEESGSEPATGTLVPPIAAAERVGEVSAAAPSGATENRLETREPEAAPTSSSEVVEVADVEDPTVGPKTSEEESATPEASSGSDQVVTPPPPSQPRSLGPDPVEGQSYLKEVTLADGRSLHLNGIVWSDTSPAALINSEVYGVGEGAGPWTILNVERGEVQIEADGVRFILRLK